MSIAPSDATTGQKAFQLLGKRALLDELCDSGLTLDLAGALLQEFRPQLVISVKK